MARYSAGRLSHQQRRGREPLQSKRAKFVSLPFLFARYGVGSSSICVFLDLDSARETICLPKANCREANYCLNTVEESQLEDAALRGAS